MLIFYEHREGPEAMIPLQPIGDVVSSVIARSEGRCECRLQFCGHTGRCEEQVSGQGMAAIVRLALTDEVDDPENWLVVCRGCQDTRGALRDDGDTPGRRTALRSV